jgi:hypothetical protein
MIASRAAVEVVVADVAEEAVVSALRHASVTRGAGASALSP